MAWARKLSLILTQARSTGIRSVRQHEAPSLRAMHPNVHTRPWRKTSNVIFHTRSFTYTLSCRFIQYRKSIP